MPQIQNCFNVFGLLATFHRANWKGIFVSFSFFQLQHCEIVQSSNASHNPLLPGQSPDLRECINIKWHCACCSVVTWPVCTEVDKRIGLSDIVWNQPPVSVAKHAEHAECHNMLTHPRTLVFHIYIHCAHFNVFSGIPTATGVDTGGWVGETNETARIWQPGPVMDWFVCRGRNWSGKIQMRRSQRTRGQRWWCCARATSRRRRRSNTWSLTHREGKVRSSHALKIHTFTNMKRDHLPCGNFWSERNLPRGGTNLPCHACVLVLKTACEAQTDSDFLREVGPGKGTE